MNSKTVIRHKARKVGLALGGGGVRGFAHVGVLKALEQNGIPIDLIVGSSAGALFGGAYACGDSPQMIKSKMDAYICSPEFQSSMIKSFGLTIVDHAPKGPIKRIQYLIKNRYCMVKALFRPAVLPTEDFQSLINYFIPDIDIQQTLVPFRVVTTDLITGEAVVFSQGPLRQTVLASCAFPGAIEPIRQGEWILADGGIACMVPVHAAREAGADIVIAVSVDRDISNNCILNTAQDVVYRAGSIAADKLRELELQGADVVIRPQIGDMHWMDFLQLGELTRMGEDAAREAIDGIHKALRLPDEVSPVKKWMLAVKGALKSYLHINK
ncbi:MAG: patatin-like phospholipase family protein [Syntrophales bacterium]|jgi:NTE family protein